MSQVLVRDLEPETVRRLKARAQRKGHSLQVELKAILEAAANGDAEEPQRRLQQLWARLDGRTFPDSAELIREDRER